MQKRSVLPAAPHNGILCVMSAEGRRLEYFRTTNPKKTITTAMMNLEIRCEFLESPVTENMLLPAPPLDDRFEDDAADELSEEEEEPAPEVSLGSSARAA